MYSRYTRALEQLDRNSNPNIILSNPDEDSVYANHLRDLLKCNDPIGVLIADLDNEPSFYDRSTVLHTYVNALVANGGLDALRSSTMFKNWYTNPWSDRVAIEKTICDFIKRFGNKSSMMFNSVSQIVTKDFIFSYYEVRRIRLNMNPESEPYRRLAEWEQFLQYFSEKYNGHDHYNIYCNKQQMVLHKFYILLRVTDNPVIIDKIGGALIHQYHRI